MLVVFRLAVREPVEFFWLLQLSLNTAEVEGVGDASGVCLRHLWVGSAAYVARLIAFEGRADSL